MIDKNLFIETLHEVAELARTSGQPMTREEIRKYFGDMNLSAQQEEMVYGYMNLPQATEEHIEGNMQEHVEENTGGKTQDYAEKEPKEGESAQGITAEKLSDSAYYQMYLNEVKEKTVSTDTQQHVLYEKLADGNTEVAAQIMDNWLMRVIDFAKYYNPDSVNAQDLIQEGNMALWTALGQIPDGMRGEDIENYLTEKVREAMENYIREVTGTFDRTQAVLGKAALLHEAQELLAKENGQEPSLRQLSEYTHIPAEEIRDILAITRSAAQEAEN